MRTDGGYGVPGMPGNGGFYMAGNHNPLQDPLLMPGQPMLPMAYGSSNLPNAIGNMGGMQNAQFFGGPQMGQIPPGFQGKYVS